MAITIVLYLSMSLFTALWTFCVFVGWELVLLATFYCSYLALRKGLDHGYSGKPERDWFEGIGLVAGGIILLLVGLNQFNILIITVKWVA